MKFGSFFQAHCVYGLGHGCRRSEIYERCRLKAVYSTLKVDCMI